MHISCRRRFEAIPAHTPQCRSKSISSGDTLVFSKTARPASAAASEGRIGCGQKRRARIPVINSSRPCGRRSRSYTGAKRASISAEVTSSGG